jgi:proline iminopeptidase
MTRSAERFELDVPVEGGGTLRAWVRGEGPPVLLLHGGPGLSATYLEPLADELVDGYRVASYQQRGLAPSTARGPYDVGVQADDVALVLDALGWDRAVLVGHSWGGHLLLHVLAAHPDRLTAAVVVEPLGGVGDGGLELFAAELLRRVPEDVAARVTELEAQLDAGEGDEADAEESLRLIWPAYYANPAKAPPMPPAPQSVEVIGPAARLIVLEDTGHLTWHESPGAVRAAVDSVAAAP